MNKSLEKRILVFSLLAILLTVAVNTGFHVNSFRKSYRDSILQRAQTFSSAIKSQVESVLNLGLPLEEISGIDKVCQDTVDRDPEISYCMIEDSSGKPLYASLGRYPVAHNVQFLHNLSGEIAVLKSEDLGKVYDFALPIYNFNDEVVGRVRIGFLDEVLQDLVADHFTSTLMVLLAAMIVVFALVVAFTRYDLVVPIRRLCDMARDLAEGKFGVESPRMRTKELSMLGTTLADMAKSLRERDAEIGRNYEDLEQTNLELQKSYENLESISTELGRSREMYRTLLDEASDAILVCDEDDVIVIANKAAERFFGLSKLRMEKNNYFRFLELIRCRDIEVQFEKYQGIAPGQSAVSEIRFWREMDERSLLGQASTTVIVDRHDHRLTQIIVRDSTYEQEVVQNLERAAGEMERLNQMKNSFLGLASHELKTPLTIIAGYVELLLSERAKKLDKDTLELIHHIAKASDRLSEIVRDMVDVSMIDGKTIDLVSQEVDINSIIHRAVTNVEPHVHQRNQYLSLQLSEDLPLVKCDVERMVQAIGNVLSNAVKFTPDKGNIALQSKLVYRPRKAKKFSSVGADGTCEISKEQVPYVEIAVCDKGIGIAEEDQEVIFDKFYEVGDVEEHSTGKVAFKSRGAGLGLSIVKGIIDLHGGVVYVESPGYDPERMPGSTFYLLLPAVSSNA